MNISPELLQKKLLLGELLRGEGELWVAFSGGVDSTLVLAAAKTARGNRVTAVTAVSSLRLPEELAAARAVSGSLGVRHELIETFEMESPDFTENTPDRCYYCKKELFTRIYTEVGDCPGTTIVEGSNADDLSDWRPGRRAVSEMGVRSPLCEAGLTKKEVRELARLFRLPNWDKPAMACLGSRFPYGRPLTEAALRQVAAAERCLLKLGFGQLRVRHHGDVARIEVEKKEMSRILALAGKINEGIRASGFNYVSLDLAGYRSGSLNEVLPRSAE